MIKKIKNINIIFFVILAIAVSLRLYNLSGVPPSASLDEVSIGWNAYSIIKTGGDEYGNKFPLLLRAYDDWRPALYAYLVAPFVQIFGLNVLAVRLPSVILSSLTVISAYFLVLGLFRKWEMRNGKIDNEMRSGRKNLTSHFKIPASHIALLTSFLLAVSPWHIYISRLGHEANAGLTFFIFGVLFFLKKRMHISFIFFALSFASYQAEKVFLPIFLIGVFILFRKELIKLKKQVIVGLAISLVLLLPFLQATFQPNALIRFSATSIFNHQDERYEKRAKLFAKAVENNDFLGKIIYNRRLLPIQIFTEGYISHFNPKWLFTNPSSDRHKASNLGLLYLFEAPLILLGLLYLFSRNCSNKIRALILLWIIASPLPGALTTDAPHAMRAYTMLPMPQILGAIGAVSLVSKISNIKYQISKIHIKYLIFTLHILFFIFNFLYFLYNYFSVFPKEQSASFQFALAKVVPFVLEHDREYNKVIFSNQDNLYQSYMFFLFYSKYDPKLYQEIGGTKSGGFAETHAFDKYEFRPIKWAEENKDKNSLYIGNIEDFTENAEVIKIFDYLNGEMGIKIVKGN